MSLYYIHTAPGHRVLSETSWPKEIASKYVIEWSLGSMRRVILSKDSDCHVDLMNEQLSYHFKAQEKREMRH